MFTSHRLPCTLIAYTLLLAFAFFTDKSDAVAQSTSASVARERGVNLYRGGRHDEAIRALKTAVKEDKTDHQAWYFLGLAQKQLDKFEDASKSLKNAVNLQSDFAPAHLALAYVRLHTNKHADAIREAESLLAIEPGNAEAHYIISAANLRGGNREVALRHASTAIELNPGFGPAYLLKSQTIVSFVGYSPVSSSTESWDVRKSRFLEAMNALEKYLQLEPHSKDKQTWIDQLDSLRFHTSKPDERKIGGEPVYSGKEVSSKARILAKPEPNFSDRARKRGIRGLVILRGILAADGTVKHLLVIQGLPEGLTESALASARRIKFSPATLNGKPVSMYIQLEYNFAFF